MVGKRSTKKSSSIQSDLCVFCNSDEDDSFRFGEFGKQKGIRVHNFCALFASGLSQNGNDDEGIQGFLVEDILSEVGRASRLRCIYCKHVGATIGCCLKKCKKVFHLQCGKENGALNQFFGSFCSFCKTHKPEQEVSSTDFSEWECIICGDNIDSSNQETYLRSPCCVSGLFHRTCIQRYAISSGYFFKCPLCNNLDSFRDEMLFHGIYVPEKDAAWETDENAYQELLELPSCGAEICVCPTGRDTDKKNTIWLLQICVGCGGSAQHVGCNKLSSINSRKFWQCPTCSAIISDKKPESDSTLNHSVPIAPLDEVNTELHASISDENDCVGRRTRNRLIRTVQNFPNVSQTSSVSTNDNVIFHGRECYSERNFEKPTSLNASQEEFITIFNDNSDTFIDVCSIDTESNQEMPAINQYSENESAITNDFNNTNNDSVFKQSLSKGLHPNTSVTSPCIDENVIVDLNNSNDIGQNSHTELVMPNTTVQTEERNIDIQKADVFDNLSSNRKGKDECLNITLSITGDDVKLSKNTNDVSVDLPVQSSVILSDINHNLLHNMDVMSSSSHHSKSESFSCHKNFNCSEENTCDSNFENKTNVLLHLDSKTTSEQEMAHFSCDKHQVTLGKYFLSLSCSDSKIQGENGNSNVLKRRNSSSTRARQSKKHKFNGVNCQNNTLFDMPFFQCDKLQDNNNIKNELK